jgi:hypothetical protein
MLQFCITGYLQFSAVFSFGSYCPITIFRYGTRIRFSQYFSQGNIIRGLWHMAPNCLPTAAFVSAPVFVSECVQRRLSYFTGILIKYKLQKISKYLWWLKMFSSCGNQRSVLCSHDLEIELEVTEYKNVVTVPESVRNHGCEFLSQPFED